MIVCVTAEEQDCCTADRGAAERRVSAFAMAGSVDANVLKGKAHRSQDTDKQNSCFVSLSCRFFF